MARSSMPQTPRSLRLIGSLSAHKSGFPIDAIAHIDGPMSLALSSAIGRANVSYRNFGFPFPRVFIYFEIEHGGAELGFGD